MQPARQPHPSTRLGLVSLLAGIAGSAIAYLGLWIESSIVGLIGFSLVGIAVAGAVTSLLWNITWVIREKWHKKDHTL